MDIHISSPVQADDIALISTNFCNMQTMVAVCENYSIDWKFKFKPLKSIQLNFSKSKQHTDIQLYNSSIPLEISARHEGVLLKSKLNFMDRTLEACRTLRSSALGLIKSGLHPSVISIDTCNRIVRQGLPRQTRSDMVNALIGWKSAESYIDERKLLFLGKLVLMKDLKLPKQIFLTRAMEFKYNCVKHQLGLIPDIHRILINYRLSDFDTYLRTGHFPTYIQRKKKVKVAVQETEESLWRFRTQIDKDFKFFIRIHTLSKGLQPAWTFSRKHPLLIEKCRFIVNLCTLTHPYEELYFLCDKCGRFFMI
ncbi:unnamed protein product [Mytilus coruscus]|uniref:Uncharacterized protein n=1 Tax=Mytilus coruscus TaxID=42192 RepID=A0A6J8CNM2_MYTCO|nr:unnamed protein product [Mytilus coruscus]